MLINFFTNNLLKNIVIIVIFSVAVLEIIFFILIKIYIKNFKNDFKNSLNEISKALDSIRYGDLTQKISKLKFPNSNVLLDSLNRMIETLQDRELMIVEYQNELSKQNEHLEMIINSLSDGLVITDVQGKIIRVTSRIEQWFNGSRKSIIGNSLTNYIKIQSKKPIPFLKEDEIFINSAKDLNFTASTIELNVGDKLKRYIIVIKNVTDQKELETLKEDFVATLTHDLKIPIIAETNMLELFLSEAFGNLTEKQRIALKNMQTSNRELLDLVQIVLDTYKVKDNKITLYKENIMLKGFMKEIIEEMAPLANKTNNNIVFNQERDIRAFADKFQLKRVIKNLIQNAISYGEPDSPIEISIGEIPHYVTIKIKDYGAGISQEDIDKVFNRYYSAAKKFKKIGTGLGLYLALQITKAHGGDLELTSKEGEFTEFCIKIPV